MSRLADKTPVPLARTAELERPSPSREEMSPTDLRAGAVAQRRLQDLANASPRARRTAQLKALVDSGAGRAEAPVQHKRNETGLPDQLKAGIEHLSNVSMDDVRVHRNSSQPATMQAHAYAQGTDIHLAPGQERHLPHEAWHVVQQKEGRVRPTMQFKLGVGINDDKGLEQEADRRGQEAMQVGGVIQGKSAALALSPPPASVAQRAWIAEGAEAGATSSRDHEMDG